MTFDHIALLPAYVAAGTAILAFLTDVVVPERRGPILAVTAAGAVATGVTALLVGPRPGGTFCVRPSACSYVFDQRAVLVAVLFAGLTLGVVALSVPVLRTGSVPPGEYSFLLAASMTGGVVLGAARDLITLIVALETLTLPLYILVGLRRRSLASAQAAVTFFVVSVVATAVTLLGAALLYAGTGSVHFGLLGTSPAPASALRPIVAVGVGLVLVGLGFKVAAVPLHAWAPPTYDGAPLPVAAYLSTASKLGGIIALVAVTAEAFRPWLRTAGLVLALFAVLSMTVGNLVALRQRRMVRLLAWSSVAQAGYILAPLGALAAAAGRQQLPTLVAATIAYTVFYVLLELGAFGTVVALRGAGDGGEISQYRGAGRSAPWLAAALGLALAGLAGLPPGLAGLFAKVVVVRALLEGGAGWLALVVAANAVVGLAYYVRVAATLFAPQDGPVLAGAVQATRSWAVSAALAAVTLAAVVVGLAPQVVLWAAHS